MGSSGGGSSGKVRYPSYVETTHREWLENTIDDWPQEYEDIGVAAGWNALTPLTYVMESVLRGENPYEAAFTYDPSGDLDEVNDRFEDYDDLVKQLQPYGDWETWVTDIAAVADDEILSTDEISDVVDAFEDRLDDRYAADWAKIALGYAAENAVLTSAFPVAYANFMQNKQNAIDDFEAKLTLEDRQKRADFINNNVRLVANLTLGRIDAHRMSTHLFGEINRQEIVAQREYLSTDLDMDVRETLFDFIPFEHAGALLAAPGGGVAVTETNHEKSAASVLGGTLSGAAAGASAGGPAGAVIGGVLGTLGSFM